LLVAVRAAIHDVGRARERVRRSRRRSLSCRADRNRAGALHHHAADQRDLAAVHLVDGDPCQTAVELPPRVRAARSVVMRNRWRRFLSTLVVVLCGLSVVLALVPLALILFYVVSQGIASLNVAFFTQMPKPVGEA